MNFSYLKYAKIGMNYLLKRTKLPAGKIMGLTIETTNICNFRCVYCPQSDSKNHFINGKGFMKLETYQKILDNILTDFTPKFVSLHRDGEPLLNKQLEKFIEYTVNKGIKAGTSSNCSLLTTKRAESLIASGISFITTDLCADKDIYEKLRVGGKWETAYKAMINILSEVKKRGKCFQMTIIDISTHGASYEIAKTNMAKLEALFSDYKEYVFITDVFFHNALGESIETFNENYDKSHKKHYTLCHHPWVHIVVDFQGNVVPCCRDLRSEYICGNLIHDSMKNIWNSKRFIDIRKALSEKRPEDINICSKCDLPYRGSYAGKTFLSKISSLFFSKWMKR